MSVAAPNPGTPAPAPGAAPPQQTPAPGQQPAPGAAPPAQQPTFVAPWSAAQGVYKVGEGDAAKPWWSGIQEEPIRAYAEEKQYATPDEALRAAWNSNKLNKLTPEIEAFVSNKATPEQEANVYKLLGRPESADKYDLKAPQGVETDPKMMEFGKNLFFKMGLSPARAQAGFDAWNEFATAMQTEQTNAQNAKNDQEMTALQTRWGAELEANRAAGHRAVQALGLSNDIIQNVEAKIGTAAIVELLAAIGKKSSEGTFQGGGSNTDPNDPNTMTKEQAASKIKQLQSDTDFQKKYTDKNHEGHKDAMTLMERLFAKAG